MNNQIIIVLTYVIFLYVLNAYTSHGPMWLYPWSLTACSVSFRHFSGENLKNSKKIK